MPKTKVPKVDLLDINREPTDEELESLMQDMVDVANEKSRIALASYIDELFAGIDEAVREGVAKGKTVRSRTSHRHAYWKVQ